MRRRLKGLPRKAVLWIGSVTIVAPLLALLAFQYRWLVSLHSSSAMARRATLDNYLEAVTSEVRYHYASLAERSLNPPVSVFLGEPDLGQALRYFRRRPAEGVDWLFVVYRGEGGEANVVFFDAECGCWGEPPLRQLQAVQVAASPWLTLALQETAIGKRGLQADERDPEARMVLNPITGEDARVLGIAGMLLDAEHFRETVLPAAIETALPRFFEENAPTHYMVRVEDSGGEMKYATDCPEHRGDVSNLMAATRPFSFVFRDWGVAVQSHGVDAEAWAWRGLALDLSLSALLGVVLLGGTVLTLRTASREMRLSRMKSDFVSNVSHELRTPLASIQTFGELLRSGRVRDLERAKSYGRFIETESRRLSRMIDGVLDFSRTETGDRAYRCEPVDLAGMVEETLASFAPRAKEQGFRLRRSDGSGEPSAAVVKGDREALTQVLINLLDNAFKYSGESREIVVGLGRQGQRALFWVRDFGVGIPSGEQERIFQRFHRVTSGLIHEVRGSGLGLAIVRHIVEAHAGEVRVESEPGVGSTFTVDLPLAGSDGDTEST